MNTYTWDCKTVDVYPTHSDESGISESNVVYNVHWRLTGTDGEHSATVIGTQSLEVSDLSSFTSFESVTHSYVITWVESAMGAEQVASLKESLDKTITEMATPSTVTLTIQE